MYRPTCPVQSHSPTTGILFPWTWHALVRGDRNKKSLTCRTCWAEVPLPPWSAAALSFCLKRRSNRPSSDILTKIATNCIELCCGFWRRNIAGRKPSIRMCTGEWWMAMWKGLSSSIGSYRANHSTGLLFKEYMANCSRIVSCSPGQLLASCALRWCTHVCIALQNYILRSTRR